MKNASCVYSLRVLDGQGRGSRDGASGPRSGSTLATRNGRDGGPVPPPSPPPPLAGERGSQDEAFGGWDGSWTAKGPGFDIPVHGGRIAVRLPKWSVAVYQFGA